MWGEILTLRHVRDSGAARARELDQVSVTKLQLITCEWLAPRSLYRRLPPSNCQLSLQTLKTTTLDPMEKLRIGNNADSVLIL